MIFYTKERPFQQLATDFYHGEVLKAFNFLYFTHSDHHDTDKEMLRDSRLSNAFFDLAAAYAAQLQYRGMLNLDRFAEQALRYFKLGLQARGYALTTQDELEQTSRSYQKTVVLVTGCQTPEVRDARVDGGYAALRYLDVSEVQVVFSGAHPGTDQGEEVRSEQFAIEPDEAGAMKVRFFELMDDDRARPKCRLVYHKESSSTRTSENIKHFLEMGELDQASNTHLLISSSAFHLPRISDELGAYLTNSDHGINRVTLIQSEHLSVRHSTDILRHQIYVKQMAYELFRMFLTHAKDRLDDLFERETSLKV